MQNIGVQETVFEDGNYEYIDVTASINNHSFTRGEIQELRIIGDLYAKDTLSIGGCLSRQLNLSITVGNHVIPKQARIDIAMRIVDGVQTYTPFPKGTFFIDTRKYTESTDKLEITAFDAMLKAEGDFNYVPSGEDAYIVSAMTQFNRDIDKDVELTYDAPYAWTNESDSTVYTMTEDPQIGSYCYLDKDAQFSYYVIDDYNPGSSSNPTMLSIARYIANTICDGLDNPSDFEDYPFSLDTINYRYSQREILSMIAVAHGGNFIITDDNMLRLVREDPSATADFTITDSTAQQFVKGYSSYTISKIELITSKQTFTAGDDTGVTISANCEIATQEIADALLTQLDGLVYTPYRTISIVSPAVEIGDHFTYQNVLYTVAYSNYSHNNNYVCELSAPSDGDIEHEYPYVSSQARENNRKMSSKLDAKGGKLDGVGVEIDDETQSKIKNLRVETLDTDTTMSNSIEAEVIKITGTGNADNDEFGLYLTKSRLYDKDTGASSTVTRNFTYTPACFINNEYLTLGYSVVVNDTVPSLTKVTATVEAQVIYAETGTAVIYRKTITGSIPKGETTAFFYASELMPTSVTLGTQSIVSSSPTSKTYPVVTPSTFLAIRDSKGIIPAFPNSMDLGTSGLYWKDVNAVNFNQISDKRLKEDISYDYRIYNKVFDKLKPATYKVIDSDGATHFGFIAQDVIKAFKDNGIDAEELGIVNMDDIISLRYTEFIALNTYQIQKLKSRIAELEERLNKLDKKEK